MYHPTPIGVTRDFCLECTQKCYYVSSNADYWSDVLFRLLYINQLPVVEWIVPKCYYVSSNVDRSDSRFLFGVYLKMLLCIIQRPLERRAFSFVIYQSTACSGVDRTQNVIMYHPTPIGVTPAFCLECTQKCYYVSSNCRRKTRVTMD
jgi:hypothetical protein